MQISKTAAATVVAAALAAGGSAALLAPAIGGAQESGDSTQESTTPPDDGSTQPEAEGHCAFDGHGPRLELVAETIGIEPEALRDALVDGQTIAEVAEANGVEVSTVVDALVTAAQERLDEAVANGRIGEEQAAEIGAELSDRITDAVNGDAPLRGPRHRHHGPGPSFGEGMPEDGATDDAEATTTAVGA